MRHEFLINIIKLLFFLIPIGLITGPFIPDLSISLMAIIFIYISIKEKYWKYYNNNYFKFFIIFNVYLITISLFSDNLFISLKSSLFYFRFIIFALCVWFLFDVTNFNFKKKYSIFLLFLLIILSLDSLIQYSLGYNIIGISSFEDNRMSSFFMDRLVLGSFLVRLLFLSITLYLITHLKFNKYNLIYYFSIIIICAGILVSGERTSFGLLIMSCLIFLVIFRFNFKFSLSILLSGILILIIAVFDKNIRYRIFIEPLHQSNLISQEILKNYEDVKEGYVHEDSKPLLFSKEHSAHYLTAYKIFLDNMSIGVGPKMFRQKCSDIKYKSGTDSCTTHPHNLLLQVLSETGLIGLFFYLVMFFYVCFNILKKILKFNHSNKNDYMLAGCLICMLANLFPLIPSGNLFNNWLSIIFYLPFGVYLYYNELKYKNE
tara:strand:- start:12810 stop:14102 length:1293 start_codon:yes stop_codon:yes gene_type:complete